MNGPQKIIIIGAGDHGRGTLEIFKACNRQLPEFEVQGFVDDDPACGGRLIDGLPVLGNLDWLLRNYSPAVQLIIGIADCRAKQRILRRLTGLNPAFSNAVHPSATLGSEVLVGRGNIIAAGVVVAYGTTLQDHVTVNLNATIGHDCRIDRFVTIAPGANIAGRVHLEEGCDIGLNSTVIKGLELGSWSALGPASVVLRNVPSGGRLFGNPARAVQLQIH